MIAFAGLLALLDVFVFGQLRFWGVVPVLAVILLYRFRLEVGFAHALCAVVMYGFVGGLFLAPDEALLHMFALAAATIVALFSLRVIAGSRLRTQLRGFDATMMALLFTLMYWTVRFAPELSALDVRRAGLFIIWSAILNLVLMIVSDLTYRRMAV